MNISVDDGDGGVDSHEFYLTVTGSEPPRIITIDVVSATANKLYRVDYEAVDDNTPSYELLWALDTNASWLSIDPNTGVLGGTPTKSEVGWYWVSISVTDGEGGFDHRDFILTVYSTQNAPPEIVTEDKLSAMVDTLYSVEYNAIDDRTPSGFLQWDMKTNASWLEMDTGTRLLTGTPSEADLGRYWVEISVTDGENGWDHSNFTVKVVKEAEYGDEDLKLSSPRMTPSEGDTDTEFTFSIHYYNAQNEEPDSILIIIDGDIHNMELSPGEVGYDGIYECKIKLAKGAHSYYFTTSVEADTIQTDNFNTPEIKEAGKKSTTEESAGWEWMFLFVVLIIIIVLIIVDLVIRMRKKADEAPDAEQPDSQPSPGEAGAAPAVQPTPLGAQETPWAVVPTTISERLQESVTTAPSTSPSPVMPQVVPPAGLLPPQPRVIRPPQQPILPEEEELEE